MRRYLAVLVAVAWLAASLPAAEFTLSDEYRSVDDSPFLDFGMVGTLLVEDFEDGVLNLPGVVQVQDNRQFKGFNFVRDGFSVQADLREDNAGLALEAEPGLCTASYPAQCPATVSFEFGEEPFGTLPTYVGFAWTDAVRESEIDFHPYARVTFTAGDGSINERTIRDLPLREANEDAHADDTFVGFMSDTGIARLDLTVVTNGGAGGHLAIDHLQIGVASIPGDADRDGIVDFGDFLRVANNFGAIDNATWEEGDFNFDGQVSFPDFLMMSGNFGRVLTSFHGAAAVPEPTTGVLVLGALLAMFGLRRRIR